MKRIRMMAIGAVAMWISGAAMAGKGNMPKEGGFEFDFCMVGETRTLVGGDKVFVSHYKNVANLGTEPAGKPFDRVSSLCYGTLETFSVHRHNGRAP